MIQVRVGEENKNQKTFSVHEGLISSRSRFVRNALNGSWQESDTKVIPLGDVAPEFFDVYLNLLYFNRLPIIAEQGEQENTGQFEDLITVYILADRLMDLVTKNLIIDAMICRVRERKIPTLKVVA